MSTKVPTESSPRFVASLKSQQVSENVDVEFSCTISGNPEPKITWYRGDKELPKSLGLPKYEILKNGAIHTLKLYRCSEDDATIYQASARSKKGIAICSAVLRVGSITEVQIRQSMMERLRLRHEAKRTTPISIGSGSGCGCMSVSDGERIGEVVLSACSSPQAEINSKAHSPAVNRFTNRDEETGQLRTALEAVNPAPPEAAESLGSDPSPKLVVTDQGLSLAVSLGKHLGALVESESQSQHSKNQPISEIAMQPCSLYPDSSKQMGRWVGIGACGSTIWEEEDILDELVCSDVLNEFEQAAWTKALSCQDPLSDALKWTSTLDNKLVRWTQPEEVTLTSPLLIQARSTTPEGGMRTPPYPSGEHLLSGPVDSLSGLVDPQPVTPTQHQHTQLQVQGTQLGQHCRTSPILPPEGPHLGQAGARMNLGVVVAEVGQLEECRVSEVSREELTFKETCVPICDDSNSIEVQENQPQETTIAALKGSVTPPGSEHRGTWERSTARLMVGDTEDKPADITVQVFPIATVERNQRDHLASLQVERTRKKEGNMEGFFGAEKYCQIDMAKMQPLLLEAGERPLPENNVSSTNIIDDHSNCRTCDDRQTPDPNAIPLSQQEGYSCESDSTRFKIRCEILTDVLFTKSITLESSGFKEKGIDLKSDQLLLLSLSGERDELDPALGLTESRMFSPVTQPTNLLNTLHDHTVQTVDGLEEKVCEEHKDTQALVQCMGSNAGTASIGSSNISETLISQESTLNPVWHLNKGQSVAEHKLAEPVLLFISGERESLDLSLDVMENSPVTESTLAATQPMVSLLITITDREVMAREEASLSERIDWYVGENETKRVNQENTSTNERQGPCTVQDVRNGDYPIVCAINEQVGEQTAYLTEISTSPVKDGEFVGGKGEFQQSISTSICKGDDLTCISGQHQGSETDCGMETKQRSDLLMPIITGGCDLQMESPTDDISICDIDTEPFRPRTQLCLQRVDPSSFHHKESNSNELKAEDQYGKVDLLQDSQTPVAMSVHISNTAHICSTISLTNNQCLDEEPKYSLDVYSENAVGLKNSEANLEFTKSSQVESSPMVAHGPEIVPIMSLSHSNVDVIEGFSPKPVSQISPVHKAISNELEKSSYGLENKVHQEYFPENILLNATAGEHDQTVQLLEVLEEKVSEEYKDTQASVQYMGSNAGRANVASLNSSEALTFPTPLVPPVWHLDKQESVAEHKLVEPLLVSVCGERQELDLALCVMETKTFGPMIEATVVPAQPVDSILLVNCEVMAREKVSDSKIIDWNATENETKRVNQQDTSTIECQGYCTAQDVINVDNHICAINKQLREQSAYPTVVSMSPVMCAPFANDKPDIQSVIEQVRNSEPVLELEDKLPTLQYFGEPDITVDTSRSAPTKMGKSDGSLLATGQPALVSNTSDDAMRIMEFNEIIVENEQESSTTCFAIIETSIHPQMMPNCALERATKLVLEEDHERVQLEHNVLPTNPKSLESLFIKIPSRGKLDINQPILQDQVHSVMPITELLGPTELNVAGNCKCSEEFSLSIDQSALLQREAGQLTKDTETTVTPSVEDSHKSNQSQGGIEESANASTSLRLGTPSVSEWLKGLIVRSAASDENNSSQTLEYRGNWKTGSGKHSELNAGQMPTQLGTKTGPGNSCIGNKPVSITRENTETKKDKNLDLPTAPQIPESHTVTQAVVNFVIIADPIEPEIQMEFGKGEDLSAPAALSCFPPDVKARTSRENTGSCCSVAPVCQTPEAPNNKVPKFPALLNVKNDTKRRKDNTEQQCSQKASKVSVQDGQRRAVGMVSSMPSKPSARNSGALELCISELAGATELIADVKCKHLEEPSSHVYQSALFQGEAGQLSKNSGTNVALSAVDGHTSDQTQDGTQDSAIVSISSRLDTPSVSEWLKSLIMRSAALGVNNSSQTPGSQSNCKSGAVENSALNAGHVISQLQTKTVAEKSCGGTKPMSITGNNTENKEGKNHHLPTTPKSPDSGSVVQPVVPSIIISDTKEPEIQMELGKMLPGEDLIDSSAPTPLSCFPLDSKVTYTDAECKETVHEIPKPPDNQTHRFPAWLNVENDSQRDKNNNGLPGAQTVSKVSAKDGLGRDVGSVSSTPSKRLAKASIAFEPCITEVIGATELTTAQNCKHSGESLPHVNQFALIQGKASQFTKDSETNVVLSAEDGHISIQSQGGTEESANVSTDLSLDGTSVSEWLKSLMVRSAASRVDNISQALGHQGDCKMVAEEHSVLNADEVAGQLWPKVEPGKNSRGNKHVSVTEEKAQANESKNHDLPMPLQSPESVTIAHPVVHSFTNVYSIEPDIQTELGKRFPRGDVNKSSAPAALHCFPSVNQVTNTDAECNETVCKTQKHPDNMTPKFPARLNVENTSQRDKADIMLLCGLKESNVTVKPGQRKVDGLIPSMPSKLLSKDSAAFAPCITKILGTSELIPAVNCKHLKESSPCLDQSSLFDAEACQIIEDSSISVAPSAEDGHTSVQSQGVTEEQADVSTGPTLDTPLGSEQLKSLMVRSAAKGVDDSSQTLGYQGDCDTVAEEHSVLNAGQVAGRFQPKTEPGRGCRGNKSASVTRENTESIQGKNLSAALNSPEFATITHTVLNSVINADTIKAEIRMKLDKGFPGGNLNSSSAPDALSCFPPDIKARTSKQNTDAEHTKMVCQILEPPNNKTPNFPAQLNVKNDSQRKKDYTELPGAQKVSEVSVQDKQRKAVEMVSSMPPKPLARNSGTFELCITELAGAAELSSGVNSKHLEESSTHVNQPALFEGDVGRLTKGSGTSVAISAEDGPTSDQSQGGTEESAIVSVGLTLDTPPVSELLQSLMVRSAALGVNNSSHTPGRQGNRKSRAVENSAMNTSQVGSKLQTKTIPGKSCGATKPLAITGNNTENNKGKNHHLPTTPKSPDSDPVAQPAVHAITIPDTKEPEIQKELGKVFPGGDLKSSAPTPLHCFPLDSKVANTGTDCKEMVHKIPKPPDKQTHKFPAWLNMENDSQREKESNELLGAQTVSKVSINKGLRRIVGSISSTPAKPLAKASVTFVPCITEVLGATELTTAVNCKHSEAPSPLVDQSALFQGQTSQFTKDSDTNVTLSAEDGHISVQSQGGTVKSANVSTGLILDAPLVSKRLKSLIVRSTALGINNSSQVLSHGGDCKMMAEEHATLNEGQVAGQLRPKTEPGKSPRRNAPASITGENIQANEGKNLDLPTTPGSPESDTVAHPVVHSLTKFDTIEPEIQMEIGKKFPGTDINKSRASASSPCFPPDFKGRASKQTKDTEPTKMVCQLLKPPSNKIPKFPTRLNVKNDSWEYEIDKDSNELLGAQKVSKVSMKKGQKRVLGLVSSTPSKSLAKGSTTIVPCTTEIVGATELTATINSKQLEDPSPCVDQSVLFPGEAGQLFKNSRHPVSGALSPEYSRTSEQSQGGTKESAKFSAGQRVGTAPVNERLKSLKAKLAALGVDNSSQTIQSRGNCSIVAREHSVLNAGQVIGRLRLKTEPGRTCKGNKSPSVTGENTETNEGKNHDPPTALKSPESGKSAHLVVNSVTNADTVEPEVPMHLGKGFPGGGHNKSSAPADLYCFPPDVKAIKKDAECKKMVSQIPMPSGNKIPKFPAQLNPENNSWECESDKDIIKLPRAQKVSKVSMQDGQRSVVGSASSMPSKPLAQGSDDFLPFDCMMIPKVKIPLAGATTKELMLGARKKVHPPKAPSEIPSAGPEPVDLITKVDDQPKKEAVKRSLLSPVRQETDLSETCSSAEKENLIEDTTGTKRICQKIGEEAAQHSDYQELRALQLQKEVQKGEEEIELLQFTVEKELTTQCNFGGQVWGRIATEEVHFGEGLHRKAFRTKVICGLLPLFDPGHTCVLKIHNNIAYGTNSNNEIIELNYKLAVQECQVQNTARQYACKFAAEGILLDAFGEGPEVIPIYLIHRAANTIPYATVEEELIGDFVKYSVKDGRELNVGRKMSEAGQKCCTFQHWVYQRTDGNLLVTDMQGVGMKLTDIGIATCSKGYKGFKGNCYISFIEQFKALHQCNEYCNMMGLKSLKTSPQKSRRTASVKTHLTYNQSLTQHRKYR